MAVIYNVVREHKQDQDEYLILGAFNTEAEAIRVAEAESKEERNRDYNVFVVTLRD